MNILRQLSNFDQPQRPAGLPRTIIAPSDASVVVVHGLASNRLDMSLFCYRLRKFGYRVINWGYASTRKTIADHGDALRNVIHDPSTTAGRSFLHVVGHSMGCIVSRAALQDIATRPENLGRVVMLAPPNGGSFVARRLSPWLGWYSQTLTQISDEPESYVNQLPTLEGLEFGVLAAKRDRVIDLEKTKLIGQSDFTIVDTGHGVMPWNRRATCLTHRFLAIGRFRV